MARLSIDSFALLAALAFLSACGSDTKGTGAGGAGSGAGGSGTGGASVGGSDVGGSSASGGAPPCMPVADAVADDCITDVSAGKRDFSCDGLTYTVSMPDICVGCACGLVFDVHGFTMSAVMEEANTSLAELGGARGYVVVQPTASGSVPSWNAANDDPKVFDFMQRTIAAFHIDPKRIHFTGFSQGGDMTWRMLCAHSDLLASVAPAAFHNDNDGCFAAGSAPPNVRPILYMHGTTDALVPFSSAQTSRDRVVAAEGLDQNEILASDDDYVWTRHHDAAGAVFEMVEHDYEGAALIAGHCFPGSTDPGGAPGQVFPFGCDPPNAFVWGQIAMDFFVANPLP